MPGPQGPPGPISSVLPTRGACTGDYLVYNGTTWVLGSSQDSSSVFLGCGAGQFSSRSALVESVAVGVVAGNNFGAQSGTRLVSVGYNAGYQNQGTGTVAIGYSAASGAGDSVSIGEGTVAIGRNAVADTTQEGVVAIGDGAAAGFMYVGSIGLGRNVAADGAGEGSIVIGAGAGASFTNDGAIVIGAGAGAAEIGANSIVIGPGAGPTAIGSNYIVLDTALAGGVTTFDGSTAGFYVNPIRQVTSGPTGIPLYYVPETREVIALTVD